MDKIRAASLLAMFILAHATQAQTLPRPSQGFVPRHQRIAASVMRKRPATKTIATQPRQPQSFAPADAAPIGELTPPAPPQSILMESHTTATSILNDFDGADDSLDMSNDVVATPVMVDGQFEYEESFHGDCQGCDSCRNGYCWIDTFSLNLGVVGFKNAVNNGRSGSFGFQEGINWGSPRIFKPLGMNTQLGFRAIQSEFSGTEFDTGSINNDHRSQLFVTGGFFKRAYCGWQGGIVADYLRDEWIGDVDLAQVRAELSWAAPNGSSLGVWLSSSVTDDVGRLLSDSSRSQEFDTQDIYAAFYRVQSDKHRLGQWRVYAGFTGDSDGLIGSDFKVPLAGTWSLEPEFTFLVPDESTRNGGPAEEGWNVAFNLVWYPGRAVRGIDYSLLPLFDVAGNGTMISRAKR